MKVRNHLRRWALMVLTLALIGFGVVACNAPYSSPGNGTPAPTSPSGY
jgi:hypothetical protein